MCDETYDLDKCCDAIMNACLRLLRTGREPMTTVEQAAKDAVNDAIMTLKIGAVALAKACEEVSSEELDDPARVDVDERVKLLAKYRGKVSEVRSIVDALSGHEAAAVDTFAEYAHGRSQRLMKDNLPDSLPDDLIDTDE